MANSDVVRENWDVSTGRRIQVEKRTAVEHREAPKIQVPAPDLVLMGGDFRSDTIEITMSDRDSQRRIIWSKSETYPDSSPGTDGGMAGRRLAVLDVANVGGDVAVLYRHDGRVRVDLVSTSGEAGRAPLWSADLFAMSVFRSAGSGRLHPVPGKILVLVGTAPAELWEVTDGRARRLWSDSQ